MLTGRKGSSLRRFWGYLLLVIISLYVAPSIGEQLSPEERDEVHGHDCAKNQRCSTYCFFHGQCLRDGSCECDVGWTGENCTEPLCPDCVRGGCRTAGGPCICSEGFTGHKCDVVRGGLPYTKPTCDMFGHCVCSADGTSCTGGELPDLRPNQQASVPFIEWKLFPECDCAADEGCTKAGKRKLLRFTMETWNIGRADLFIGNPGDYVRKDDAHYVWHQCHEHPHFVHWVQFVLRNRVSNVTHIGWKSGSAIIDSKRVLRDTHVNPRRKYVDELQGLQVGWADWYPYWLDCQWIDITDVEPGDYQLEITVNPTRTIVESDYSNNMVIVPLQCRNRCVHGKCDFGTGCICDPGWEGHSCEMPVHIGKECVPDCTSKSCGSDGCGGDCGLCPQQEHCDIATGSCTCTPQCINKYCGSDGCGGDCDKCPKGQMCTENFRCVDCVRNCTNKKCGDDGCGRQCGYCQDGLTCDHSGQCVCLPNCTAGACGSDGCGGSCGKCGDHGECVPDCNGKECGSDGCGGSCGHGFTCPGSSSMRCSAAGKCVCVPACDDKECGADGCGGSCGTCQDWGTKCHQETGQCTCEDLCGDWECGYNDCGKWCGDHHGLCPLGLQCQRNKCVCVPECKGKHCGSDGCGDVCGSCAKGFACNSSFLCECQPNCAGKSCGPDGCGGNCGKCASHLLCNPQGECTDCVPDCQERQCGSNGCPTGNCGTCPEQSRCLNRWVCVGHDEVVPREEFKMVYISPTTHHTKALPETEAREQRGWLKNMSVLLSIPEGSIEVVSWEYFSVQQGGEMRKVYFYIYNSKVRTAIQSGKMLTDLAATQPEKLAAHGFTSVEVEHIRMADSGSFLFSAKVMLFLIGVSVLIGGCVLLVLLVLLIRALAQRSRQQRVTHVVLQPEMDRFLLGEDIDDL